MSRVITMTAIRMKQAMSVFEKNNRTGLCFALRAAISEVQQGGIQEASSVFSNRSWIRNESASIPGIGKRGNDVHDSVSRGHDAHQYAHRV